MPFTSLGLSNDLLKIIDKQGFTAPYPIQKEATPEIMKGKDLVGIAPTGTGKTACYLWPIIELIQKNQKPAKNRHPKVLIMVPTRELAIQIQDMASKITSYLPKRIKSFAVFGGVSINPQMINLQGVEILIATPGRLIELTQSNALSLSEVQILVLDEADKLLNPGFKEEMDQLLRQLPKKRQTLLFSATLNEELTTLNQQIMRDPVVVKIDDEIKNLDLINLKVYYISEEKKGPLLRYIIKHNNLQQVLIFTSSTHKADGVTAKLNANGIDAVAIHSKKSQGARTDALWLFKSGKIRVLVATDLMGRGIDIKELPCVINYELPRSPKDFTHRIGRTGRAEANGEAISLVTPDEAHHYRVIQKKMKRRAEVIDGNEINLHGF